MVGGVGDGVGVVGVGGYGVRGLGNWEGGGRSKFQ